MRKCVLLVMFFSFLGYLQIYSNNNSQTNESQLTTNINNGDWDEIEMQGKQQSGRPKSGVVDPIKIYKNSSYLKLDIVFDTKLNIQIVKQNGATVYSTKYVPGDPIMLINIAGWNYGNYKIILKDTSGLIISTGDFKIC